MAIMMMENRPQTNSGNGDGAQWKDGHNGNRGWTLLYPHSDKNL